MDLKYIGSPIRVQALCPGFTYTEFHDVIKMDRSNIPDGLWMTSDDVVEASLQGLEKNRLFVIPGWRYQVLVRLSRLLPRTLRHFIAFKYQYK